MCKSLNWLLFSIGIIKVFNLLTLDEWKQIILQEEYASRISNAKSFLSIDLHLRFEKSIWTNLIFVNFELDFYCLCSVQKSSSK